MATNNLALPAKLFHAMNGFDIHFPLAADREFCHRWLQHGYTMTYVPEALVYHNHHLTLLSFWRQQFNYGRGAFLFHRTKRSAGDSTPEPKSFYWHLIRYPFSKAALFKAFILATLMVISQVAVIDGYLLECLNRTLSKTHLTF
ncbi:MAG: glycosyltransferase family 2 protein [Candidatus Parabeggiatoa sp.]|nr:glycosyltransferase family 2 protein [Candidatus Parabeggiatoa sp.]